MQRKFSLEHRRKLSESHRGKYPSKETIEKRKKTFKRIKFNQGDKNPSKRPEVREKMRLAKLGKHQSQEHIEKRRQKMMGHKAWNKNMKFPNLSIKLKQLWKDGKWKNRKKVKHVSTQGFQKGRIPWNKNRTYKELFGEREAEKRRNKLIEERKLKIIPTKDTTIEVKIQNFLKELKIEFLTHHWMNIEHGYQCDILIPSINIVIECFGTYWHKYPVGREIDNQRCQELRENGYKVFVFWENEIRVMELNDLKRKLI